MSHGCRNCRNCRTAVGSVGRLGFGHLAHPTGCRGWAARDRSRPLETARDRSRSRDCSRPLETARDRSRPLETARDRSRPLETARDRRDRLIKLISTYGKFIMNSLVLMGNSEAARDRSRRVRSAETGETDRGRGDRPSSFGAGVPIWPPVGCASN